MCGFSSLWRSVFALSLLLISNFSQADFTVLEVRDYALKQKLNGQTCKDLASCIALFPARYQAGRYEHLSLIGFVDVSAVNSQLRVAYRQINGTKTRIKEIRFRPSADCLMNDKVIACGLECTSSSSCLAKAQASCPLGVRDWSFTDVGNWSYACSAIKDNEGQPPELEQLPDKYITTGFAKGERGLQGQKGEAGKDGKDGEDGEAFDDSAIRNDINSLSQKDSALKSKQDSIASDVAAFKTSIDSNKASSNTNANNISSLFQKDSTLQSKQDLIASDVASNKTSINSLIANPIQGPKGDQGLQGAQGLQGEKGEQGIQGFAGIDGKNAESCTASKSGSVTTISCPDGSTSISELLMQQAVKEQLKSEFCFVSNVNESTNVTTYSCPNGIQTVQVKDGQKGEQGIQGLQGIEGPQGEKGDDGIRGLMGAQGPQGDQGQKGDTGEQGPQGLKGVAGTKGIAGTDGTNGTNGIDGTDGVDGSIVDMNKLIDYLKGTSIDVGDWTGKANTKFDAFSKDGIYNGEQINVQDQATSYLSGNGVAITSSGCPNAESITILGSDVSFSYQPMCDLASLLKPLLLAFTWISAMVLYFRSL